MFKSIISRTPLTEDVANEFFSNIKAESFDGDVTMLSTIRALVAPRMGSDETLSVCLSSSDYSKSTLSSYTKSDMLRNFVDVDYLNSNTIRIHKFLGTPESIQTSLDIVEQAFCQTYSGWCRLDNVTRFFRKQFKVLCYINPEQKSVVIFTENMNIRKYHYLQCGILAFLPWYFDPSVGISELELDLLNSLKEKTPEMYEECISKIADQYDFRTERIKKLLYGFETRYEQQECEKLRRSIQKTDNDIDYYFQHISEQLRIRRDMETKLLGFEAKIAKGSGDSEIMEYFLSNRNVWLENVTSTTMTFVATGYLEFFDEDLVKSVLDNDDSYVYAPRGSRCNNIIPHEDMRMFMEAVFLEQKLRLRVCAAYNFEFGIGVNAITHYNYPSACRNYTPNPHIDAYRCMGNYRQTISKLIQNNDYLMALEQCIASNQSLNFADGTVMSEFMSRLYGISDYSVNMCCVELPDGKVVTPKEAIKYLKAEGSTNE